MDFKVKRGNSYIPLISSANKSCITSAVQKRKLCGEDTVTINLTSAVYIQFQIGDTIDVFGTTYTINQLPTVKKINDRNYEYTLVFEGLQYSLIDHVFLMPDNTQGNNLMLDLEGMMDVLIDNLNRDNSGKTWKFECPSDTEYKNLSLTEKNCLQVLQQFCQEWNTEFTIVEGESDITIKIGQAGAQFPITFTYGQNGGIYELNRDKGATDLVTRLFCYGGTQNLTWYRYNRLCLPSKTKNQSYVEDATAIATYGLKEAVKNFDDIYPNRIGTVTSVSGCAYNEFIDNTMNFDLNEKWPNTEAGCEEWLALKGLEDTTQNRNIYFNDVAGTATRYLMPGATAKIHFNTGALAGYECDLHSYDPTTKKFTLIPLVDENGYDFPSKTNTTFRIGADDEYVILEINLPESYKEDAEEELQAAAEEYFATVCNPQPKYTLELEPLALQKIIDGLHSTGDREIFATGDTVHIIDSENSVNATIRINSFDRDLIDPYKYKLSLADEITYTAQVRTLIEVNQIKRVIQETGIADPNKIRRGWKDAEELYNMVFDTEGQIYGEKIQPLSIDTTMLKVGARSQQLTLQNVTFQPNYLGNPARLEISGGYLVHLSIDPSGPVTWTMSAASISNLASTGLYVYARVLRSGSTGVWLVSDQQIVFDSESGYYNFLIGTLGSVDSLTNTRTFSATYGFSTINGRYIKTGRIQSADGATWFDLDSGTINGNIVFQTSGSSYDQLQSLISGNSSVQTANTNASQALTDAATADGKAVAAQNSIDNLEIGGRNLMPNTQTRHFTLYASATATFTDNTTVSEWNTTEGIRANGAKGTNNIYGTYQKSVNWSAKQYVVSIYIKNLGQTRVAIAQNGDGTKKCIWEVGEEGRKYFVVTSNNTGSNIGFNFIDPDNVTGYSFDFVYWHPKVEEGNRPTDWTPAPEDTEAAIAAEAQAQTAALGLLANRIDADIADLQDQIDGRVETWFGDYEPTDQNEPWYTWRTQNPSQEADHLGDMFYDNTTGYAYRFINSGTTASPIYGWLRIADSDVEEALALAREAKTAADGKMQVFVTTPTPPYEEGDMWVQGENGDILYCVNAKSAQGIYEASDWATASKYTDDTQADLAMAEAKYSAIKTATCSTAASTQTKTVTLSDDTSMRSTLKAGDSIVVTFTNTNTAATPKFQIGSRTAYNLIVEAGVAFNKDTDSWAAGDTFTLTLVSVSNTLYWLINGLADVRDAKAAAATAQTKANQAYTQAENANADLANYGSDQVISPTEKTALKQQLADINAEKDDILAQAAQYQLTSTTEYTAYYATNTGAYQKAVAALNKYTAATAGTPPSPHIPIESDYANIAAYYTARQAILEKIAEAAQAYADTTAAAAVANLEVGGRNLHKDSENIGSSWGKENATVTNGVATLTKTTSETRIYQAPTNGYWEWETDTEYAVSIEAKAGTAGVVLQFQCYGGGTVTYESGVNATLSTDWKRYVCVFKTGDSVSNGTLTYRAIDNNSIVQLRKPKLEKGNKATDWTPAPEDEEYARKVGNLVATCDTASNTLTKEIICEDLTAAMLTDSKMRMKIKFTNASGTGAALNTMLVFKFKNSASGSYITPSGASYADVRVWYKGAESKITQGSNTVPYWNDGQEVEFVFKNTASGYARLCFPDEEDFDTQSALFKAYKGSTQILGGLVLTDTVICGSGSNQAGMNGLSTNNVAFWAGGSIGSAQAMNTPVVILRDGNAKFGILRIDKGGTVYMDDSDALSRLIITRDAVSNYETSSSNSVTKCPSNATQSGNEKLSVGTQTVNVSANGTYTLYEVTRTLGTTIEKKHNGMLVYVSGTVTIQRTITSNNPSYSLQIKCQDRTTNIMSRSFMIGEQTYQETIDIEATYWANSTNPGSVDIQLVASGFTGGQSDTVQVSGLYVRWYHDVSVAKTVIAGDGLAAIVNTSNFFRSIEKTEDNNKVLETTIKGNIDIPGVLWAGEITAAGGGAPTPSYHNANVTLSKNGTSPTDTSLYNFKYTGIVGTPIIMATPEVTSDNYGWTAAIEKLSPSNQTFSVRIKRDNTKLSSAFHLVIFGTT